ncbi:MAG: helix-turn-helix transcriptional regulator [Actinomycetota bacterium]
MADQRRAVFIISVAAELAGVHPQTLRTYERKGLVEPGRTAGNTRRYSEKDIARLRRIQELTQQGLNLEGVRRVLALEEELERVSSALSEVTRRLKEEVEAVHRSYRRDLVPTRRAVVAWKRQG